ncbi:unnamed protein product [Calicophoron daubneyi]|uniref:Kinesin motor domain-containing protein n=1 Tax=Calicophoron daubneyi TaxID=300641 RepID=A0AAV2T4V6_CALDB
MAEEEKNQKRNSRSSTASSSKEKLSVQVNGRSPRTSGIDKGSDSDKNLAIKTETPRLSAQSQEVNGTLKGISPLSSERSQPETLPKSEKEERHSSHSPNVRTSAGGKTPQKTSPTFRSPSSTSPAARSPKASSAKATALSDQKDAQNTPSKLSVGASKPPIKGVMNGGSKQKDNGLQTPNGVPGSPKKTSIGGTATLSLQPKTPGSAPGTPKSASIGSIKGPTPQAQTPGSAPGTPKSASIGSIKGPTPQAQSQQASPGTPQRSSIGSNKIPTPQRQSQQASPGTPQRSSIGSNKIPTPQRQSQQASPGTPQRSSIGSNKIPTPQRQLQTGMLKIPGIEIHQVPSNEEPVRSVDETESSGLLPNKKVNDENTGEANQQKDALQVRPLFVESNSEGLRYSESSSGISYPTGILANPPKSSSSSTVTPKKQRDSTGKLTTEHSQIGLGITSSLEVNGGTQGLSQTSGGSSEFLGQPQKMSSGSSSKSSLKPEPFERPVTSQVPGTVAQLPVYSSENTVTDQKPTDESSEPVAGRDGGSKRASQVDSGITDAVEDRAMPSRMLRRKASEQSDSQLKAKPRRSTPDSDGKPNKFGPKLLSKKSSKETISTEGESSEKAPVVDTYLPFTLTSAGLCDANDTDYFPLQEQITYLEGKLIDTAMQRKSLEDNYETLKKSHYYLEQAIKKANFVARDRVVFEDLKLNYDLACRELEEGRALIKELQSIGWENLPSKLMERCKESQEKLDEMRLERDRALHEESATRGIASEALKQVKLLKTAIESHKQMTDEMRAREATIMGTFEQAVQELNTEWEQRLFRRHVRDKRRQLHLENLVHQYKELTEKQTPKNYEEVAVGGQMLPESAKNWDLVSKVTANVADAMRDGSVIGRLSITMDDIKESTPEIRASSGGGVILTNLKSPHGPQNLAWADNPDAHRLEEEKMVWNQIRLKLEKRLDDKDEEIESLKQQLRDLGKQCTEGRIKAEASLQLDEQLQTLMEENKILSDHYRTEQVLRKKYYNIIEDMKGKIRVYCRLRPITPAEESRKCSIAAIAGDEYTISIKGPNGHQFFQFDRVFDEKCSQEAVFNETSSLIQTAIDGYNVCIFGYGTTGSGKSHTLFGDFEKPGLSPRIFNHIFQILEDPVFSQKFLYDVSVQMFDLHNNDLYDLFRENPDPLEKIEFHDDDKTVYVPGAIKKQCCCAAELHEAFHLGVLNRQSTLLRDEAEAARTHLIITIFLTTTSRCAGTTYHGKLSIIEMAGSEKTNVGLSEQAVKDIQMNSMIFAALGDVIASLTMSQSLVPYKNSKLTTLMEDSIGGNSKTLMFITVSPLEDDVEESIASLNYAARIKTISNHPKRKSNLDKVNKLKSTIDRLRRGEGTP